jgi:hypothetical protein
VPVSIDSTESQEAANARSFRERLNAIEMR